MTALRVVPTRAALLVVDFQERLVAAMPPAEAADCQRNILMLLELARRLAIPVVCSEQYPGGLGPTVPAIAQALDRPDFLLHRFEKIEFACTGAPAFKDILHKLARDLWIVVGLETHVCVYQTVRGLAESGAGVHVPHDAVLSRASTNYQAGLGLCDRAGAVITSTEAVIFDALGTAASDDFKAMSALVKEPMPSASR